MVDKGPYTPNSRIRQALRQLWLRSKERAEALKRDKYTCQVCKRKQTMAKGKEFKVQVHHKVQPDWDKLIKIIRKELLMTPDDYVTLCKEDHKKETDKQRE